MGSPSVRFIARVRQGWHPPMAVSVVTRSDGPQHVHVNAGSGLLVGRHHVVTCAHVFVTGQEWVGWSRDRTSQLPLISRQHEVTLATGRKMPAIRIAVDPGEDLAILRLAEAADCWGEIDLGPLGEGSQMVVALGFKPSPDLGFTSCEGPIHVGQGQFTAGQMEAQDTDFGAREGFSGGPVYGEDVEGQPIFAGLLRMGGDAVNWGKLIARDRVLSVLARHTDLPLVDPVQPETDRPMTGRRRSGFLPEITIGRIGCLRQVSDLRGIRIYVAALPVAHRALRPEDGAFGGLAALHEPQTAAEVHQTLQDLSSLAGRPFRLPDADDLRALLWPDPDPVGERPSARPRPYILRGLPADLRFFEAPDGTSLPAPEGMLEWLMTAAGPVPHRVIGPGQIRPAGDLSSNWPAAMRVVLDV